ncbi:MAG: hypothetical protein AB8G14_00050 [Ilumatobacter sp.]
MSPTLMLLNGPPASGKSTVAERLVALRPLALAALMSFLDTRSIEW